MSVDFQHTFPLTHENALWCLHHAPWNNGTKHQLYKISTLQTLHRPLGDHLKRVWYLGDRSYPLPRHYMRRFGLGSADDIVCLIIQNFLCQLRQEDFHMTRFVSTCQNFWRERGKDPVTLQDLPPRLHGR
jgi:hypothetical protein